MFDRMDRGFRRILWMSWTLRSRALFFIYTIRSRITQNTFRNYQISYEEIYNPIKLKPITKKILESYKLSSINATNILDCVSTQCTNMNLKNMMDILAILTNIYSKEKNQFDLRNHEGFQILCEKLKKQVRIMSLSDAIQVLKLLNLLEVPASTMIMQSLLQTIRNSVNDLDIHQVHLLSIILRTMEQTTLSSVLQTALPIIISNILTTKLDYSDLKELSLALLYIKDIEKKHVIDKIYRSIKILLIYNAKDVSVSTLKTLFISLCILLNKKQSLNENCKTMEATRQALLQKINQFTPLDVLECIRKISKNVLKEETLPHSYDNFFINELLNVAISKNMNFITCCKIARSLNVLSYVHLPFIRFIISKYINENVINQMRPSNMKVILRIFSNAQYESVPWILLENKFLDKTFLMQCSIKTLINYGVDLAALNKYYPRMLSIIFTRVNKEVLTSFNIIDLKRYLLLYQTVKTLYSDYSGPLPNENELFYTYHAIHQIPTTKLRATLKRVMGGPQYVSSHLRTNLLHSISHAVIIRQGGFPIAFNTNSYDFLTKITLVEDFEYPKECSVILIIELPDTAYSINTQQLLGVRNLQIKTIEKWTRYNCVPININIWSNLPQVEKMTYIMQQIKCRCPEIMFTTE